MVPKMKIILFILKKGYLKWKSAYAILCLGKNDESVQCDTQKTRRWQSPGFSIPFWKGGLCPRLATCYSSLSSHLQMRWQTTPATTEMKNDESISNVTHPLPLPV